MHCWAANGLACSNWIPVSRGVEQTRPSNFYEKGARAKDSTDRDLPTEETRLKLLSSATDTPDILNFCVSSSSLYISIG